MKTKTIVAVLLIALVFAVYTWINTATPRANNFALVFQYTPCGPTPMYILDTASGTLVYTPIGETTSTTISLHLTPDELESIYQKATGIGFWNYPSKFVVPFWQVRGYVTPAASYEIRMTNGMMRKSISWTDDARTRSNYTKADKLRELTRLIYKIIESHPEVQQLPGGMLCE